MVRAAYLAVVVALAGCSQQDDRICITPLDLTAMQAIPNTIDGYERKLDACVHRWAYRIAGAEGSAADLGRAAVGGCDDAVLYFASAKGEPNGGDPSGYARERAEAIRAFSRKGAFYVATARAGRCNIP